MKHLVFYKSQGGHEGNVDCEFLQYPPTIKAIRELEASISEKFCENSPVFLTGWMEVYDPDDPNPNKYAPSLDAIELKINGTPVYAGNTILITNDTDSTKYVVTLGEYTYENMHNFGWYLLSVEDSQENIRPLLDLIYDETIVKWEVIE